MAKPQRRVPCEFCERKFADDTSLGRHVRELHKKAAKLVAELRERIKALEGRQK